MLISTKVRVGNAWGANDARTLDFVRRAADAIAVECSRFGPLRRAVGEAGACEVLVQFVSSLSAGECSRELSGLSFDGRPLTCVLDEADVAAPEPSELRFWQYDPDRKPKSHRDRPPTPVPERSRSRSRSRSPPQGLVADYSSDDD